MLFGNACDYISESKQEQCRGLIGGLMTQGMIQYNTHFYQIITKIYETYLSKKYTNYTIIDMLEDPDLVDIEYTFRNNIKLVYDALISQLTDKFNSANEDQEKHLIQFFILFMIVEMTMTVMLWSKLFFKLKRQERRHKEIFKLIPYNIVLKNRTLKTQLMKTSKKTFSALKM